MKNEKKNNILDSMASWLAVKAAPLLCASIFMATSLCASGALAFADAPAPLAWVCWIGDEGTVSIYCIHDRREVYQVAPDNQDEELEAALLDQIYERVISKRTAGLENFAREHSGELRNDALWVINIWSYPYESSWEENMPIRLVRAGLCPKGVPCTVLLNKPTR